MLSGIKESDLHFGLLYTRALFHTDIAEWVLNKCALSKPSSNSSNNQTEVSSHNQTEIIIEHGSDEEETDFGAGLQPQTCDEGTRYTGM